MIPDINIWRVANLMLKRYGDLAEVESARRADELWEVGDAAGAAVWRRVMGAVRRLVNMTPLGWYTERGPEGRLQCRSEPLPLFGDDDAARTPSKTPQHHARLEHE